MPQNLLKRSYNHPYPLEPRDKDIIGTPALWILVEDASAHVRLELTFEEFERIKIWSFVIRVKWRFIFFFFIYFRLENNSKINSDKMWVSVWNKIKVKVKFIFIFTQLNEMHLAWKLDIPAAPRGFIHNLQEQLLISR